MRIWTAAAVLTATIGTAHAQFVQPYQFQPIPQMPQPFLQSPMPQYRAPQPFFAQPVPPPPGPQPMIVYGGSGPTFGLTR